MIRFRLPNSANGIAFFSREVLRSSASQKTRRRSKSTGGLDSVGKDY